MCPIENSRTTTIFIDEQNKTGDEYKNKYKINGIRQVNPIQKSPLNLYQMTVEYAICSPKKIIFDMTEFENLKFLPKFNNKICLLGENEIKIKFNTTTNNNPISRKVDEWFVIRETNENQFFNTGNTLSTILLDTDTLKVVCKSQYNQVFIDALFDVHLEEAQQNIRIFNGVRLITVSEDFKSSSKRTNDIVSMSSNIAGPFFAVTYNLPPLVNVGGLKDRYLKLGSSNSFTEAFVNAFIAAHTTIQKGEFNKNSSFYKWNNVLIPVHGSVDFLEDTIADEFTATNDFKEYDLRYLASRDINTDGFFNKKYLVFYSRDKLRVNQNVAFTTNIKSQKLVINPDNSFTFNVDNGRNNAYDITVSTFNHYTHKNLFIKYNISDVRYYDEIDSIYKIVTVDTPIHEKRLRIEAAPPVISGTLLNTYDILSDSLDYFHFHLGGVSKHKVKRNTKFSNGMSTTLDKDLNISKSTYIYDMTYMSTDDFVLNPLTYQTLDENDIVYLRYFTCVLTIAELKTEFPLNKDIKSDFSFWTENGQPTWIYKDDSEAPQNTKFKLYLDQSKSKLAQGKTYNAAYFTDPNPILIMKTELRTLSLVTGTDNGYKNIHHHNFNTTLLMDSKSDPKLIKITTSRINKDATANDLTIIYEELVFQLEPHPDNSHNNLISFMPPPVEFVEFELPPLNPSYIYFDFSSNENTAIYDMNSNEIEAQFENKIENSSVVTKFNSLTAPYSKMIEEGNDTNRINSQFVTGTKDYNFVPKQTQIVSSPFDKDFELELNTKVSDIRLQLNFTPIDSHETPIKMF